MPFWSRKQEYVDPLINVVREWSSDVLLIAWTYGHHEEGMARISLGLPPREETEQKELDFTLTLISEFGFERASHVITYGLSAAKRTNYECGL